MEPTKPPPNVGNYVEGLLLGCIPLIPFLFGFSPGLVGLFSVSVLLWVVFLIVAIVSLFNKSKSVRLVGYGLLTSCVVSPIVVAIGCAVAVSQMRI